MTVSAHEDAEAAPALEDRDEAMGRREGQDEPLAVGRPAGRLVADEGDPASRGGNVAARGSRRGDEE